MIVIQTTRIFICFCWDNFTALICLSFLLFRWKPSSPVPAPSESRICERVDVFLSEEHFYLSHLDVPFGFSPFVHIMLPLLHPPSSPPSFFFNLWNYVVIFYAVSCVSCVGFLYLSKWLCIFQKKTRKIEKYKGRKIKKDSILILTQ